MPRAAPCPSGPRGHAGGREAARAGTCILGLCHRHFGAGHTTGIKHGSMLKRGAQRLRIGRAQHLRPWQEPSACSPPSPPVGMQGKSRLGMWRGAHTPLVSLNAFVQYLQQTD